MLPGFISAIKLPSILRIIFVKPMIAVESPDGDDIAVLYFNPNKIQGSGSYESMKLLEDLVKEKHLTQDDVLTVLNAVKLTNN